MKKREKIVTLVEGSVKVGWSWQVVRKGVNQKFATLLVVGWAGCWVDLQSWEEVTS